MKVTTKIYHILWARFRKDKHNHNMNYIRGYRAALLDVVKQETEIKQGRIDYVVKNGVGYIITPK